ncbi:MAG: hypothetical protein JWQ23_379 [Herminiimonas sp.]|nr:hypothetical protein [Herminiimonas sp.]
MKESRSIALQGLLAKVAAAMGPGGGERIADVGRVQEAQDLGCEVATGATYTRLIFAIEAEIGRKNIGG